MMYFYGCVDSAVGHSLKNAPDSPKLGYYELPVPHIDGSYAPRDDLGREVHNETKLSHVNGWTVVAMWDRTVDSRPGSNANFIVQGTVDEAAVWALAKEHFPQIVARLPRTLKEKFGL